MKYIIASDIHGSSYYTKKLQEIILKENPDKIILLGDIYYHGPRNNLPKKYNPKLVCEILNGFADKIICVKGNCDAEVDQMISKFKFKDSFELDLANKKALFVHGHKLDKQTPPTGFDFIFSGAQSDRRIQTAMSKGYILGKRFTFPARSLPQTTRFLLFR